LGKKNRIKKPAALLAQAKTHRRLAEAYGKQRPELKKHWEREAKILEKHAAELMEDLPQSYLEEIESRSDEEAEKLLRKKRGVLKI
jgi:hypothetical protein